MANANNSNMNIPNTFNLTGTWQNNVDPLSSRNGQQTSTRQQTNVTDNQRDVSSYLPTNNNNNNSQNLTSPNNEDLSLNQIKAQTQTMSLNQIPFSSQAVNPNININRTDIPQATVINGNAAQSNYVNPQDLKTLANFAKTQIGKNATIEFLIGENSLVEKTGAIVSVGENYILLNETSTRNLIACDLKNIEFIYFEY